ncbi:hypothetical protein JTB14_015294 [Gonioctena quinquepunctata]|nr:hypothetical protein JTB14_015294 [Gonioctena quinquepunctata]
MKPFLKKSNPKHGKPNGISLTQAIRSEEEYTPKKRRHQVMLTRLRLGQTRLTHEYLVTCSSQPTCEICEARLTIKHILCDCPLHYQERINHQIPETLKDILSEKCNINSLISFLNTIDTKKKALARFKNSKLPQHWSYYKELRNLTNEAIKAEKKAYLNFKLNNTNIKG